MGAESTFATGFDEPAFRDAIKQTMRMGLPPKPEDRLVWHWNREREYVPEDPAEEPYSWTQTPVVDDPGNPEVTNDQLVVDYAFEFSGRGAPEGTMAGSFENSQATVTLLDTEYEQVKDADFCTLGPNVYEIEFSAPTMGLFGVGVYQVYLTARDES